MLHKLKPCTGELIVSMFPSFELKLLTQLHNNLVVCVKQTLNYFTSSQQYIQYILMVVRGESRYSLDTNFRLIEVKLELEPKVRINKLEATQRLTCIDYHFLQGSLKDWNNLPLWCTTAVSVPALKQGLSNLN